jgi:hypothetical protein
MDDEIEIKETSTLSRFSDIPWQTRAILVGGVIGAAVGVTAAYMLSQRSKDGQPPKMSVGEGVKIGVLVFGLLRSIANI